jgi:hypothetical protein
MILNIHSSSPTIKKIYDKLNIKHIDDHIDPDIIGDKLKEYIIDNLYDELYNQILTKSMNNNCNFVTVNISDLKIGDFVHIQYTSMSYKYIDSYENISGIVIFVDKDNNDALILSSINNTYMINSFVKYSVTPSYYSHICKLKLKLQ